MLTNKNRSFANPQFKSHISNSGDLLINQITSGNGGRRYSSRSVLVCTRGLYFIILSLIILCVCHVWDKQISKNKVHYIHCMHVYVNISSSHQIQKAKNRWFRVNFTACFCQMSILEFALGIFLQCSCCFPCDCGFLWPNIVGRWKFLSCDPSVASLSHSLIWQQQHKAESHLERTVAWPFWKTELSLNLAWREVWHSPFPPFWTGVQQLLLALVTLTSCSLNSSLPLFHNQSPNSLCQSYPHINLWHTHHTLIAFPATGTNTCCTELDRGYECHTWLNFLLLCKLRLRTPTWRVV